MALRRNFPSRCHKIFSVAESNKPYPRLPPEEPRGADNVVYYKNTPEYEFCQSLSENFPIRELILHVGPRLQLGVDRSPGLASPGSLSVNRPQPFQTLVEHGTRVRFV